jgi:two-component system, LuxR family, response regulator FixJ
MARTHVTTDTPTIFVIDDQSSVRHALGEMLSAFGYSVETFESADSFLLALDPRRHGCIIADVRMPGMDGIELVRELARRRTPLPVVVISGHADVPMAVAAIKAGAEDFIEKPIDDVQLVAAINRGLAGAVAQRRVQERVQDLRARFDRLTPRELEVFDMVVEGYTSEAIAERLKISIRTVEGYRVQIMNKMQAESVAVLVRQAIRLNRIPS